MKILLLLVSFLFVCASSFGQYCVSGGPSNNADSNIEFVSITGSSGSINYTGCPGVTGVEHYTAESVSLGRGNSFSLDVLFGTCGGNYAGAGEVWIDFNQNFTFESNESIGTWTGTPPTAISTFNFTVPLTSTIGPTRMRIMHREGGAIPLDPCSNFTWGSVTDFNVVIVEGVDCSGYVGDDLSDAIEVSALPYTDNSSTAVCYTNQHMTYSSPDVYYRVVTDPANPWMEISLCGSAFDTFLSVIEPNGGFIAGNDDGNCGSQSELVLNTANYPVIYIVVEGWGVESGDYSLSINDDLLATSKNDLEKLRVYPNPVKDYLNLTNESAGRIEIRDINGGIALETDVAPFAKMDVSNLSTGVYFIKYIVDEHFTIKKLIKE